MNRLFDYDGRFMSIANRIANLIWLGVMTFLFSVPVITAGASLTAMYYTVFQMREKGRDDILRSFWHGFVSNLPQSTLLWLLMLAGAYTLYGNINALVQSADGLSFTYTVIVGLLFVMVYAFMLPMQARFENNLLKIIRNSFLMGVLHFPKAVLIVLLHAAPFILLLFYPAIFPAVLVLGLSAPAYFNSKMLLNAFSSNTPPGKPAAESFEQTGREAEK